MLSKSKYISGLQCAKRLWLQKRRPDLAPPIDEATQARFQTGHRVGELAQQLFPGGIEMSFPEDRNFEPMLAATQEHLKLETPAIYEAAFAEEEVLVLCDILQRTSQGFDCYEVKSSVKLKSYHLDDAAIQYYVLKKAGISVQSMFVLTLNGDYFMEDYELDVKQLFKKHDVTQEVLNRQAQIPAQLKAMKEQLTADEPDVSIGSHCHHPFTCEFKSHCWPKLPSPSVFEIPGLKERAWTLYHQGKVGFEDLEPSDLNPQQQRYVQEQQTGWEKIDAPRLRDWLDTLEYPLYFLDFESIRPTLPLYPHTRPYQPHFPVQYSLHIIDKPGAEPKHLEYLADFSRDFREELARTLLNHLGEQGSILAYWQSFEKTCLGNLAEWCPQLKEPLQALLPRFKDLIVPFRQGWCYKAAMKHSFSIKSVYPALFPASDLQYQGLNISNGDEASQALLSLAQARLNPWHEAPKDLLKDLLAYCRLDTLAMVKIHRLLTEMSHPQTQ